MKRILCILLLLLALAVPAYAQAPPDADRVLAQLEAEGYFERCRGGDAHACSYFVRLFVYRANPNGNPNSYGALRKTAGGTNVEGYAEDAIALNANSNDFGNVIDLVGGTGAPGARIQWGGPHPRRASDVWEAPSPLPAHLLSYLRPGGGPGPSPIPTPIPSPSPVNLQPVLDAIARLDALVRELHAKADGQDRQLSLIEAAADAAAKQAIAAMEAARDTKAIVDNMEERVELANVNIDRVLQQLAKPVQCRGQARISGTLVLECAVR